MWKFTNMIKNRTEIDRYIRLKIENTDFGRYKNKIKQQITLLSQRTRKLESTRKRKKNGIKNQGIRRLRRDLFKPKLAKRPTRDCSPSMSSRSPTSRDLNKHFKDSIVEEEVKSSDILKADGTLKKRALQAKRNSLLMPKE